MKHIMTFLNDNTERNLEEIGHKALQDQIKVFEFYSKFEHYHSEDEWSEFLQELASECEDMEEVQDQIDYWTDLPPFNEYGLAYDYEAVDVENDQLEDYFRYELSWGGPSDEIRFYGDGRIEYRYLDWFCGVGFDVTDNEAFQWVRDYFKDCGMMDFEAKREEVL